MPGNNTIPSITAKRFTCPHCDHAAHQVWFDVYADRSGNRGDPPHLVTAEDVTKLRAIKPKDKDNDSARAKHAALIKRLEKRLQGSPFLWNLERYEHAHYAVDNLFISYCTSCDEIAIWKYDTLLYPHKRYEVSPSDDLAEDIKRDFNEARDILDLSPRGAAGLLRLCIQKLCIHLGLPGKNIDADIGKLVERGLDPRIQKALDIVRVVGNESVHPGTMDLRDDRETAAKLFELVNRVAYERITRPNELEALYSKLPAAKLAAIAKRDAPKGP